AATHPGSRRLHRADHRCVRADHAAGVGRTGRRHVYRTARVCVHRRLLVHAPHDSALLLRRAAVADDLVAKIWLRGALWGLRVFGLRIFRGGVDQSPPAARDVTSSTDFTNYTDFGPPGES